MLLEWWHERYTCTQMFVLLIGLEWHYNLFIFHKEKLQCTFGRIFVTLNCYCLHILVCHANGCLQIYTFRLFEQMIKKWCILYTYRYWVRTGGFCYDPTTGASLTLLHLLRVCTDSDSSFVVLPLDLINYLDSNLASDTTFVRR